MDVDGSTHDILEWNVEYKTLQIKQTVWSPRFCFRNLTFKFKCTLFKKKINLSWKVFTPFISCLSPEHLLLCWAGLKRSDGIFYHRYEAIEINEPEMDKVSLLGRYFLRDLERDHLMEDGRLKFFFRLREQEESIRARTYVSVINNMYWLNDDIIREDIIAHDTVEWSIECKALQRNEKYIWIPRFCFKNLTFQLMYSCTEETIDLSLEIPTPYRIRSSEYLLYWAGLKHSDGNYYHRIESREIKSEVSKVSVLNSCFLSDLERYHLIQDGRLTFFLRLSVEKETIKAQSYTNGVSDVLLQSMGRIREVDIANNHVEWDVDYKALLENRLLEQTLVSPLFSIGNHNFSLAFSYTNYEIVAFLKQYTPPSQDSSEGVLCWQGLKLSDGTYHHIIECKERNLSNSYSSSGTTLGVYIRSDFEKRYLTPNGHLTFFLRFNVKQPMARAETSTNGGLDISPRGIGSIVEENWTSYRQVKWNVDWKPSPDYVNEDVSSPVFVIENQRYLWGLMRRSNDVTLCIFRMGPVVKRFVQWWATVKRDNVTYHHQGSQCGKLDLNDEKCAWWAPVRDFKPFIHFDGRIRLSVDFLVRLEQTPTAADTCIHVDCQSPQDFKHLESGDVIFLVKGKELKTHRALLDIRVPALSAVFQHDCIEKKTGVVHIEDCEPYIFETFLNFVYSGETSEVTLNNVIPLYMIADKYLFEELKVECLKFIELHKESLSPEDMNYLRYLEIFN